MSDPRFEDLRQHLTEIFGQHVVTEERTDLQPPLKAAIEIWTYPLDAPMEWVLNPHTRLTIAPGPDSNTKVVTIQ